MNRLRFNLDALGVCASSLCMVHCLAMPVLLLALPMLTLSGDSSASETEQVGAVDAEGLVLSDEKEAVPACCASKSCCEDDEEALAAGTSGESGEQVEAACCSNPVDFWIHVGLAATVAPLGLVAWGMGFRRHGGWGILLLGTVGVSLLIAAILFGVNIWNGRGEQIMTVAGSICMVTAHLWNRHRCRCCQSPELESLVELQTDPKLASQPV